MKQILKVLILFTTFYLDAQPPSSIKWTEAGYTKNSFCSYLDSYRSTPELSYTVKYFTDTNLIPHKDEEIVVYSVERKTYKTYFTDSTGKIELYLAYGEWFFYAKKLGAKQKLKTYAYAWTLNTKDTKDFATLDMYVWENSIKLQILFESGKSKIKPESYSILDDAVAYLKRKKDEIIEIAGHTDGLGDAYQNLVLSKQRADAIKSYFVAKGISEKRIYTIGKGQSEPISDNQTEKGRALNRRIEIRIN